MPLATLPPPVRIESFPPTAQVFWAPPPIGRAEQGRGGGEAASSSSACGLTAGVASLQGGRSAVEPVVAAPLAFRVGVRGRSPRNLFVLVGGRAHTGGHGGAGGDSGVGEGRPPPGCRPALDRARASDAAGLAARAGPAGRAGVGRVGRARADDAPDGLRRRGSWRGRRVGPRCASLLATSCRRRTSGRGSGSSRGRSSSLMTTSRTGCGGRWRGCWACTRSRRQSCPTGMRTATSSRTGSRASGCAGTSRRRCGSRSTARGGRGIGRKRSGGARTCVASCAAPRTCLRLAVPDSARPGVGQRSNVGTSA